ncbi:hypothetical protein MSG28_006475 [Choristoneura fumiferana]|uniref:Uncharacterized protein n=1 Tax=Choristoneura fumiferana TaxID=7141 RepID=A0ACC0JF65_CHOFU|nr:hypothetical protein MSG28_006475 [Choristoneura fumiferana]
MTKFKYNKLVKGAAPLLVPFLSEAGHICPTTHNPADFVLETLLSDMEAPAQLSVLCQNGKLKPVLHSDDSIKRIFGEHVAKEQETKMEFPTTFLTQFLILTKRMFVQNKRNAVLFGLLFIGITYLMSGQLLEWDRFNGSIIGPAVAAPLLALCCYGMGFGPTIEASMKALMSGSYLRYGVTGLTLALYQERQLLDCPNIFCLYADPNLLLRDLGMTHDSYHFQVVGLLAFTVLHRILAYLALSYKRAAMGATLFIILVLKTAIASEQYKTSLISVIECENPELPYTENTPFDVHIEAYNSSTGVTLIRGSLTVKCDVKGNTQKGALSYGYETPNGINWVYELKNLDCTSFVTKMLLSSLGIPFVNKCMIRKGTYIINKVDVDKMDHAVQGSMARKYGIWNAIISYYTKTHTLTCCAGKICSDFVNAVNSYPGKGDQVIAAVAARDRSRAEEFAKLHNIATVFDSYQAMADSSGVVDVVYIGALNPDHFALTKLFLKKGKHVLCEKPMCLNLKQTQALVNIARQKKLFLMEAVWSRFAPVYLALEKDIDSGKLGDVKLVEVNFGVPLISVDRLTKKDLGGSALLDIGVYTLQFAQFIFKDEPTKVTAVGTVNEEGVDIIAHIILEYSGGRRAVLNVEDPFHFPEDLTHADGSVENFPLHTSDIPYYFGNSAGLVYESLEVVRCIKEGLLESPRMSLKESLTLAKLKDTIRKQIGVHFDVDDQEFS